MTLELAAPAKLNLTLEVLGGRTDGYHEIASVMQTIDLCDRVRLEDAPTIEIDVDGERTLGVPLEGPRNLAYSAALALREVAGRQGLGARIRLEKRIPAGLGLGGGSSDAAAVLRGLNRLWLLGLDEQALINVAPGVGSDVTFFLTGGTALVRGRGEKAEALPDGEPLSFTLFICDLELEDKTRRMYSMLSPADFTDGRRTKVTAETLRRGLPLNETDLVNAFDRHIGELVPTLAAAMGACRDAGLAVVATGSGPGFFTCTRLDAIPHLLLRDLDREWGVSAIACRSLRRADATAISEV